MPEAPGGTTCLPERVANARFIAGAHDGMPVALRLIRAAIGAADPGAAMQAALNEEQAPQAPRRPRRAKPAARKRGAVADRWPASPSAPESAVSTDDSDHAMWLRQDREQAQCELARKKNIGRAEGEPEFAPCGNCGHVHNESSCPRCEGDGEEDCAGTA